MDTHLLEASKAAESVAWRLLDLAKLAALDHPPESQSHIDVLAEELARARKPIEESASTWSVAADPAVLIEIKGRIYRSAHSAAVGEVSRFLGLVQQARLRELQLRAFRIGLINRGLGMNLNLSSWEIAKPVIADELNDVWVAEFRVVPDQIAAERKSVSTPMPARKGSRRKPTSKGRQSSSVTHAIGRPRKHEQYIALTCEWWDAQASHISWAHFRRKKGKADSTLRTQRRRGEEYLELARQYMKSGSTKVEEFLTRAKMPLDKYLEPVRYAIAKLKDREKVRRQ